MDEIVWHLFDYDQKDETAPPVYEQVWVADAQGGDDTEPGVTVGWFDGFTFNTLESKDDCNIIAWAELWAPEFSADVLEAYRKGRDDDE